MDGDLKNTGEDKQVPDGLYEKIVARIAVEQRMRVMRRRVTLFAACAAGSLAAFIPASGALWTDISRSGFLRFISLFFSDPLVMASSGGDYFLSLAESLPAASAGVFLLTLFFFIGSLKLISQNLTFAFPPANDTTR